MPTPSILLFTKTTGFRHDSIPAGVEAVKSIGSDLGFHVEHTEDSAVHDPASLADFAAVMWLSTSGDVLCELERAALADYVTGGGGWCGVHAASTAERSWPYFRQLVGARFIGHPPGCTEATVHIKEDHPSTSHLQEPWTWTDEWYSFDERPTEVKVLLEVDEGTYDTADLAMGNPHPLAWHRTLESGRCFYTALGHDTTAYSDPVFLAHIRGGLESVLPALCCKAREEVVSLADGIRVIVTDIGSVLCRFDPEHRFERLAARTGVLRGELEARLFDSGFETRCEAGEFTADEIREQVSAMTGFDGDTDELSSLWTSAFTLDQEVLEALTNAGRPLAIFSNNGPLFADYFDERFPEAARWFRHRYFACRLKSRKPEPLAFEAVEQSLAANCKADPHQLLLIDDNRTNTATAAKRGWQVHTYTNPESLKTVLNP